MAQGSRDCGGPFLGVRARLRLLPSASCHGDSLPLALPCQAAGRDITHLMHAPVVPILLAS